VVGQEYCYIIDLIAIIINDLGIVKAITITIESILSVLIRMFLQL